MGRFTNQDEFAYGFIENCSADGSCGGKPYYQKLKIFNGVKYKSITEDVVIKELFDAKLLNKQEYEIYMKNAGFDVNKPIKSQTHHIFYTQKGNEEAKNDHPYYAQDYYNKAIALKPDYAEAYYRRGLVFVHHPGLGDAKKDLDKAIELKPDFAEAYCARGWTYSNSDEKRKLKLNDYNEAIRLNPNLAVAYESRAYFYFEESNTELACRDAIKACELGNCFIVQSSAYENRCDFSGVSSKRLSPEDEPKPLRAK